MNKKIYIKKFIYKALSSQLETILDNEQQQMSANHTNETGIGLDGGGGTGGGTTFWNSDETFEDYYNEGRHAWSFVLHVVIFVSFMSIYIYI